MPPTPLDLQAGPRVRRLRYEPLTGERCSGPIPPRAARTLAPPDVRDGPEPVAGRDTAVAREAETTLRLVLDVLDGHRPALHLADRLTLPAVRCVRAGRPGRRSGSRSRLSSMRICRPARGVAEVSAVYRLDGRARAVAARFEEGELRWRCVAIRLG